jgi:hypothetical protein
MCAALPSVAAIGLAGFALHQVIDRDNVVTACSQA